MARKAYRQAAANAIWFDMRLIHSIADQDICENDGSGRKQARTLHLHIVVTHDFFGRFLYQVAQSMMQVIARYDVSGWISSELEQVIGAAAHQDGAAWWKHDWQRVHQDRDVIVQSLDLFEGGRIMCQELFRHIACANRQRFGKGRRWALTLDRLCTPASTIYHQQRCL